MHKPGGPTQSTANVQPFQTKLFESTFGGDKKPVTTNMFTTPSIFGNIDQKTELNKSSLFPIAGSNPIIPTKESGFLSTGGLFGDKSKPSSGSIFEKKVESNKLPDPSSGASFFGGEKKTESSLFGNTFGATKSMFGEVKTDSVIKESQQPNKWSGISNPFPDNSTAVIQQTTQGTTFKPTPDNQPAKKTGGLFSSMMDQTITTQLTPTRLFDQPPPETPVPKITIQEKPADKMILPPSSSLFQSPLSAQSNMQKGHNPAIEQPLKAPFKKKEYEIDEIKEDSEEEQADAGDESKHVLEFHGNMFELFIFHRFDHSSRVFKSFNEDVKQIEGYRQCSMSSAKEEPTKEGLVLYPGVLFEALRQFYGELSTTLEKMAASEETQGYIPNNLIEPVIPQYLFRERLTHQRILSCLNSILEHTRDIDPESYLPINDFHNLDLGKEEVSPLSMSEENMLTSGIIWDKGISGIQQDSADITLVLPLGHLTIKQPIKLWFKENTYEDVLDYVKNASEMSEENKSEMNFVKKYSDYAETVNEYVASLKEQQQAEAEKLRTDKKNLIAEKRRLKEEKKLRALNELRPAVEVDEPIERSQPQEEELAIERPAVVSRSNNSSFDDSESEKEEENNIPSWLVREPLRHLLASNERCVGFNLVPFELTFKNKRQKLEKISSRLEGSELLKKNRYLGLAGVCDPVPKGGFFYLNTRIISIGKEHYRRLIQVERSSQCTVRDIYHFAMLELFSVTKLTWSEFQNALTCLNAPFFNSALVFITSLDNQLMETVKQFDKTLNSDVYYLEFRIESFKELPQLATVLELGDEMYYDEERGQVEDRLRKLTHEGEEGEQLFLITLEYNYESPDYQVLVNLPLTVNTIDYCFELESALIENDGLGSVRVKCIVELGDGKGCMSKYLLEYCKGLVELNKIGSTKQLTGYFSHAYYRRTSNKE